MQNEVVYINHWKNNVANAKGWADNTNLNDQDFEILASDIFAKTGVLLSVTTLKRIWGKVSKHPKCGNIKRPGKIYWL
jgi:hypothetical protein